MAGFTLVASRRVIDRFSRRRYVVVTAGTLPVDLVVIHAVQWYETASRMAATAILSRQDVSGGLRGCRYDSAACMATIAFAHCAGECAAAVTITATCHDMRAVKAKTGRIVIKVGSNCSL